MKTVQKAITDKLETLLVRTHDAEKGFSKAAENTSHLGLKAYFKTKSEQRKKFSDELMDEIKALDGDFDKEGSMQGSAHRTWMDLKSYFTNDDAEAMLEEAITGEKKSVEDYKDVIYDTAIPPSIKSILQTQLSKIENGLSTIKTLEDIH
ncbi:PA2169 family four-helix-bundle protein [Wenyingzhuangia sp. 2_MG-2023]|uniref:ferritin-like domain-containing protein n=1 Tax=Wenyingzhuangia sp. 2_MG-2023 TaxID=3062639 RepID=UPI0026E15086|nr:PA2169 family four-helix-bundle protein [Wenyingzhuangia sp. 2_MG-2023]MDO6737807.1 PA2169 family four-helix-bundle protein [Wenyingzhuangia sp. 2_MG-2023]MDO6802090.1 PA2169 family four-helix-bundle protein [Wenyingzhuangia sp. 1_MG-2023]